MFVQGPPVYIKVSVKEEESTSVFLLNEDVLEMSGEAKREPVEKRESNSVKAVDPSLARRITYLGLPFSRQIYHPLQFVLDDETLTGSIEKIDGETILIGTGEGEKEFVSVEMRSIVEILWRGDPFVEN